MKFDEDDHKLHARIHAILPTEDEKCAMLATLMGMSGLLTEFVADTVPPKKIPDIVKYAMAISAGNLMAFVRGEKIAERFKFNMDLNRNDLGEQKEELIYRKMKFVVKMLHKEIVEEEKNDI